MWTRMSRGCKYPFMRLEYSDGEVRYIDDGSYQYNTSLRNSTEMRPISITVPNKMITKDMYKILRCSLDPRKGKLDAKIEEC